MSQSSDERIRKDKDKMTFIPERVLSRVMELQGECKIQNFTFMRVNLLKAIPLLLLTIISFFGLFALKYSPQFRKMLFYSDCDPENATHLHIQGSDGSFENEEIESIIPVVEFFYKKIKYSIINSKAIPQGFHIEEKYPEFTKQSYLKNGLSQDEVEKNTEIYGVNEHKVEIPNYFEYLLDKLTAPFFILQYIFCISFILTGFLLFGAALLSLSFITTTINYILLYFSFLKIRQMAERHLEVKVIRNGQIELIHSRGLVPGDIIIPQREVPCDALMIEGTSFVNQANLTGQSNPVGKFSVNSLNSIYQHQSWLYQGSDILQVENHSRAVVINTGFISLKGRIIRRILTRETKEPNIYKSALSFMVITSIIGIFAYGANIGLARANGIQFSTVWLVISFFDILSSYVPSPLPIYFNLNYSFSLARLRCKGIVGTQVEKTVVGSNTKIMCFDKTGTITEDIVHIKKIIPIHGKEIHSEIQKDITEDQYPHILQLFSTCHTTKEINSEFHGDQIDKEVFLFSQYKMTESQNKSVIFRVKNSKGSKIDVLRVNQFQSRFALMSVLVRNLSNNKLYVYVKGAPEKLYSNSQEKPAHFFETIEKLSLEGFRTIAIGFKEINQSEKEHYLQEERTIFQQNIQLLGLVAFENKIKNQAFETFSNLRDSNIECKIITGDNIYIGIETAIRVGVLKKDEKVLILEGRNQVSNEEFRGKILAKIDEKIIQEEAKLNLENLQKQKLSVAIDSDFLKDSFSPELVHSIKVFARIPPEKKALVVKKLKQKFIQEENQLNFCEKLFNMVRPQVGMCGDGANDLLALKQADLSLGLQSTDASYAASFSINHLSDVDEVIRESKNVVSSIIHLLQYIISCFMPSRIAAVLMSSNAADHSSTARFYYNFSSLLILPILYPLSRPTKVNTPAMPNPNFLQRGNQLVIWGNAFFCFLAILAGYLYFKTTDDFEPTTRTEITFEDQPSRDTADNTVMLLIQNLLWAFTAVLIYWGDPWKEKFYTNYPLLILFILNVIASTAYFFITPQIENALDIKPISLTTGGIIFAITVGAIILDAIYLAVIRCLKFYEMRYEND